MSTTLDLTRPAVAAVLPAVDYRPVLVPTYVAMATLGVPAEQVWEMVDCGELRWVWDVSVAEDRRRELRFWLSELMAPQLARAYATEHVVDRVVGHALSPELRAVTVGRILYVSRATVLRLVRAEQIDGRLMGHTQWVHRGSLKHFLSRRLVQ
jgi:hypothetical protein